MRPDETCRQETCRQLGCEAFAGLSASQTATGTLRRSFRLAQTGVAALYPRARQAVAAEGQNRIMSAVVFMLIVGFHPVAFAQSASSLLASLPESAQEEIKKLCLPTQFSDGAAAYRACVTEDIARRQASNDNPTLAAFDALSFDDKLAIQQLCPAVSSTSSAAHQACLAEQINRVSAGESLNEAPTRTIVAAALPAATATEDSFTADTNQSTAPQVASVIDSSQAESVASVVQDDSAELAPLATIVDTQPVAVTPLADTNNSGLTGDVSPTQRASIAANDASSSAQNTQTNTTTTRVISSPQIDVSPENQVADSDTTTPLADSVTSADTELATTIVATTEPVVGNETGNSVSMLDQFSNLQPDQIRTGLLYGAPILLLALLATLVSVFRKRQSRETMMPFSQEQSRLDDDVRFSDQRFEQFDDTDALQLDLGEDTIDDVTLQQPSAGDVSIDESIQIDLDELPAQGEDPSGFTDISATLGDTGDNTVGDTLGDTIGDIDTNLIETGVLVDQDRNTLGSWLTQFPTDQQKEYIIEYLLYWISYGEGQFDPSMKAELLATEELSNHDQIKRWVLSQDGESFTDALRFCQTTFDSTEIEQILNLIFAVLVKHQATPTQNVFLRFFADINGIGATSLGLRYERAFGKQLPPMPRPDNIKWWHKLTESESHYRNPVHNNSERDQNLDVLGLVDPVADKAVISAFEQISDRFDPELFDQLGEKERALIDRHRKHYISAYQSLTGEPA